MEDLQDESDDTYGWLEDAKFLVSDGVYEHVKEDIARHGEISSDLNE